MITREDLQSVSLLAYRREGGLSQTALAGLLSVDPGTLSRWERGVRIPTGRHGQLVETFLKQLAMPPRLTC